MLNRDSDTLSYLERMLSNLLRCLCFGSGFAASGTVTQACWVGFSNAAVFKSLITLKEIPRPCSYNTTKTHWLTKSMVSILGSVVSSLCGVSSYSSLSRAQGFQNLPTKRHLSRKLSRVSLRCWRKSRQSVSSHQLFYLTLLAREPSRKESVLEVSLHL